MINKYWDPTSKSLICVIDAALNYYFIRSVKHRLVKYHGLVKYKPLVTFNTRLLVVSIAMDVNAFPSSSSCLRKVTNYSCPGYAYWPDVPPQPHGLHAIPPRRLHGQAQH